MVNKEDYSPEWDKLEKEIKVGDKIIYQDIISTIINIDRYKDFESSISSVTIEMDKSKEVRKFPISILIERIISKELRYESGE